jgi:hypothetical protein
VAPVVAEKSSKLVAAHPIVPVKLVVAHPIVAEKSGKTSIIKKPMGGLM